LGTIQIKPVSDENEDLIGLQMGRKKQLSPLASILMIYLRQNRISFYLNPASDSFPQAELMEMREFVESFQPFKIDSQFERNFRKALDELEGLQVILKTKLNDHLFEITPIVEILLPADEITNYKNRISDYYSKHKANEQIEELEL
jgi:hypothetical protein